METNMDTFQELLDGYLPSHYAPEAVRRLQLKGFKMTKDQVRNAKKGRSCANKATVLTVLAEMATEEKEAYDLLNKTFK
ncbi:hypothetical protein [Flavobacterium psychrotrophum]|uniref:hypothetical protein n=1 Tax=Flavobacterium psychrotrophum TaxID=2294119 RepID=UPI000E3200E2|nr:hypothetical protein [Flavobacterium psychrotrophum]